MLSGLSSDQSTLSFHNNNLYMQNNQNCLLSKCDSHNFSLKAIHKERRPSLNAVVVMCRSKQTKNKKNKNNCKNYNAPVLNRDRCHATPAFILPSEKANVSITQIDYIQSQREFLRDHEKKVREYDQPGEELYIPKPRSKNMHCNVCRQNYEEYIQHIRSQSHRNHIHNTPFNQYILELQNQFKQYHPKELPLHADTGSRVTQEEDVEIVGINGRKKIKINHQNTTHPLPFSPPTVPNYAVPPLFYSPFHQYPIKKYQMENCCSSLGPFPMYGYNPYYSFMHPTVNPFSYGMYCLPFPSMTGQNIYHPPF